RLVVAIHRAGRAATLEHAGELIAQLGPFAVILLVDAGAANVLGDHRRGQVHRAEASAEEAGAAAGPVAAFRRGVERDVIGDLAAFEPHLAGHHGAEIGIIDRRLAHAAAHHDAGGGAVIGVAGVERADDAGVLQAPR